MGLGLLSSPADSVRDFGGGVVLTSGGAAALRNGITASPGLSTGSSLSPFAASLVGVFTEAQCLLRRCTPGAGQMLWWWGY